MSICRELYFCTQGLVVHVPATTNRSRVSIHVGQSVFVDLRSENFWP